MRTEIKELKDLHKEMTNFSNWLEELKSACSNTSDLDSLILNPELFNVEMNRRKVVSCAAFFIRLTLFRYKNKREFVEGGEG